MELIYHRIGDQISNFDIKIVDICRNNEVNIICPYINLDYLKKRISITKNWKLITDLEEWIKSNKIEEREKIKEFVEEYNLNIHNCKDIHAKIIFNDSFALVGSANFTNKGITKRIEMSVLIEDEDKIKEIKNWFFELWNNTESVKNESLNKFIESSKYFIPNIVKEEKLSSIQSLSPKFNMRLVKIETENNLYIDQSEKARMKAKKPNNVIITPKEDLIKPLALVTEKSAIVKKEYMNQNLEITEKGILIRINERFKTNMTAEYLYESTRGIWRISGLRRDKVRFAFSVYKGIILEVYEVHTWHQAGTTSYQTRENMDDDSRSEFLGTLAKEEIRNKYKGQNIAHYFKYGNANPIKYVNI